MQTALVTGASSGIGRAIAKILAKNHYQIIITGRRLERLLELKKELENEYKTNVLALNFDIRHRIEVEKYLLQLDDTWANIDVLVNNAGLAAGLDPIQNGNIEDWEQMIDTNIKGLLYVFRTLAPGFCKRKKGHIINIGSIAGKQVYPNGNVYCASKHAVDALSKAMRIDMLSYGIKVTEICPGAVDTEFSLVRFHGDQERADNTYKGYEPLYAEDIAECVLSVLNLPPNICVNEMTVMPTAQADSTHFNRTLNSK